MSAGRVGPNRLLYTAGGIAAYVGILNLTHMSITCMKESPTTAATHVTIPHRLIISPQHVQCLKEDGLVVIDNVLSQEELARTRAEIIQILDYSQQFIDDPNDDLTIRSDSVMWITEKIGNGHRSTVTKALMQTLRLLRSIPFELTSLYGFEEEHLGVPLANQLACYDGGGSNYVAHRDAPAVNGDYDWVLQPGIHDRALTMVLYLNESTWDSTTTDGENCDGNLRCFMHTENADITGETAQSVVNIEPIGGRLVIFDSKRVLHAVLPTSQRRIALTSWIGGTHSSHGWLRNMFIPFGEIDWDFLKKKLFH